MKGKKVISMFAAFVLAASTIFTGCGTTETAGTDTTTPETTTETTTETEVSDEGGTTTYADTLTIEIYDVAANYQGLQAGWFGKVVKDKFNIELNIIAPQASGDGAALYQTRASSGNLGDIIILDNPDFNDCIKAGLVKDISGEIGNYPNLMTFDEQITLFNDGIEGAEGKVYGIPTEMTTGEPTDYDEEVVYSSPMMPWDYYAELGYPEMKNLDDLLDVLSQMKDAHPTNADGSNAYPFSLWADWDNGGSDNISMENVNQLTKWYGEEVKGSILLGSDGTIKSVTEDSGTYYTMLHFLFDANQRGLVDPDSGTQNWDAACTKMKNKQVYLFWYSWQRGFWNTVDRGNSGESYIYTPVADMDIYQPSVSYYGSGRVFGVGSQVEGEAYTRIMEFLDWLASPEGLMYQHSGMEGFNYEYNENGELVRINQNALMDNLEVPAEYGGGGFNDGNNAINQWIAASMAINPETNETYNADYWKTFIAANQTTMTKEWTEKYGAANQVEYLKNNDMLAIVPNVNVILASDTTDISLIRSQCGDILTDYSWRMVFAESEEEFTQMWAELKETLDGLGWAELVEFDTAKFQVVVDKRTAALQ